MLFTVIANPCIVNWFTLIKQSVKEWSNRIQLSDLASKSQIQAIYLTNLKLKPKTTKHLKADFDGYELYSQVS